MLKPAINFFKEGVVFRITNGEKLRRWIIKAAQSEGHDVECINYIFCSDAHLRKINKQYLQHDYFTDIITFDNSEKKKLINGDIFISIDRVKTNTKLFGTSFNNELNRVMVHGVLHLLGYNDDTDNAKKKMRELEERWLTLRRFK